LTLRQLDLVTVGQAAEILTDDSKRPLGTGKIVFIGLEANPTTGLVPAHVRLANPKGLVRSGVPVQVRFGAEQKSKETK
jgi:multidrug efflux pump subunit AcrA (membrane-fusion protein)